MINVFEIEDIRRYILGFVYPRIVTKGMTIEIMKGRFDPFLSNQIRTINTISKRNDEYVLTLINESIPPDTFWYKIYTYLYPNKGDVIRVVKYTN